MIEWYLKAIKNYVNFSGRARRSEFWYYTLMNLIILFVLLILISTVSPIFSYAFILYTIFIIIPNLAVAVRRLHDTNKSGWYLLLYFIPFGGIWLLILFFTEGNRGDNRFGEDPKNPYSELDEIGQYQEF